MVAKKSWKVLFIVNIVLFTINKIFSAPFWTICSFGPFDKFFPKSQNRMIKFKQGDYVAEI